MNKKSSTDCCVQTDLDLIEINLIQNILPKMISYNLLSGSITSRNQYQKMNINFNTVQLRKVNSLEQNQQIGKRKINNNNNNNNNKYIHNEYEQKIIRKKQLIPKSFHIETINNIATPQQIVLPQKQQFPPLHVLKRKLNYQKNNNRFKTCPDDCKFSDRSIYTKRF